MIENTALSIFVSIGDISHVRGAPSDEELEIIDNKDLQGLDLEEAPFQEEQFEFELDVIDGRELKKDNNRPPRKGPRKKTGRKRGKKPGRKRGTRHKRNKRRGSRKVRLHILVLTYLTSILTNQYLPSTFVLPAWS